MTIPRAPPQAGAPPSPSHNRAARESQTCCGGLCLCPGPTDPLRVPGIWKHLPWHQCETSRGGRVTPIRRKPGPDPDSPDGSSHLCWLDTPADTDRWAWPILGAGTPQLQATPPSGGHSCHLWPCRATGQGGHVAPHQTSLPRVLQREREGQRARPGGGGGR